MEKERREQELNEVIVEPYVPDLLARGISREIAFNIRCRAMSWRWLQEEPSGWSQGKRARTGDEITKGRR
jgi:hypothetical protein